MRGGTMVEYKCKWCGEEFTPRTWADHCSENCLVNDMEAAWDPERRQKLQDAFDRWLDQQEKEIEKAANSAPLFGGANEKHEMQTLPFLRGEERREKSEKLASSQKRTVWLNNV